MHMYLCGWGKQEGERKRILYVDMMDVSEGERREL